MANPSKGEVALEAGGKAYKLCFSANALCELEDALDMPIEQIGVALSDPKLRRIKTVRACLWAGLTEFQPDITIKQAGEIVQELSLVKAMVLVGEAMTLAFPEQASGVPDPQTPGGPKAASGTGSAS